VSPGKTMLVSQGFSVSPAEQRDVIIKSEGDPVICLNVQEINAPLSFGRLRQAA
jgi:hypothetical protein